MTTAGCAGGYAWDLHSFDSSLRVDKAAPGETFSPSRNSETALQDVVVSVTNTRTMLAERQFADGFQLKRRTAWRTGTFNASPEPVVRGSAISIQGQLALVDWANDRYVNYAGRAVAVDFRTDTGSYSKVKLVTTDAAGYVRTTVTAQRTGVWRLRYGGNSIAGKAVVAGDRVVVTQPPAPAPEPPPPGLPPPRDYANCDELNQVYHHGVGRTGARDSTSGTPVTTVTVDDATYELNTESDRDQDGIACEQL